MGDRAKSFLKNLWWWNEKSDSASTDLYFFRSVATTLAITLPGGASLAFEYLNDDKTTHWGSFERRSGYFISLGLMLLCGLYESYMRMYGPGGSWRRAMVPMLYTLSVMAGIFGLSYSTTVEGGYNVSGMSNLTAIDVGNWSMFAGVGLFFIAVFLMSDRITGARGSSNAAVERTLLSAPRGV